MNKRPLAPSAASLKWVRNKNKKGTREKRKGLPQSHSVTLEAVIGIFNYTNEMTFIHDEHWQTRNKNHCQKLSVRKRNDRRASPSNATAEELGECRILIGDSYFYFSVIFIQRVRENSAFTALSQWKREIFRDSKLLERLVSSP